MLVTRKSMVSGVERSVDLDVTQEQLDRFERGEGHIQDIFPQLTAGQREFIMTGITDEEWDELWPDEEDDADDWDLESEKAF
jgi:hypothetical protein